MFQVDLLYPYQFNREPERTQALQRFQKSIQSALNQTYPIRICICDFSIQPIKRWLDSIFVGKEYRYSHVSYNGAFSPSKVRNYGVKHLVESDWFIINDIDLVIPPNYVRLLMSYAQPGVVRISPMHNSLDQRGGVKARGNAPGNGLVHKDTFYKVRAYDCTYLGYGPEDVDLNFRMSRYGKYIAELDLGNDAPSHIWHSAVSPRDKTQENERIWAKRKEIIDSRAFKEGKVDIVVNPSGWGEV